MSDSDEIFLQNLAKALRAARIQSKMTQNEAAERAGVTREYWAHVESQGRNLTFVTARKMAVAVGVTLAELIILAENSKFQADGKRKRRGPPLQR